MIQRAIYKCHPGRFTCRTRRAVPNNYRIIFERFLGKAADRCCCTWGGAGTRSTKMHRAFALLCAALAFRVLRAARDAAPLRQLVAAATRRARVGSAIRERRHGGVVCRRRVDHPRAHRVAPRLDRSAEPRDRRAREGAGLRGRGRARHGRGRDAARAAPGLRARAVEGLNARACSCGASSIARKDLAAYLVNTTIETSECMISASTKTHVCTSCGSGACDSGGVLVAAADSRVFLAILLDEQAANCGQFTNADVLCSPEHRQVLRRQDQRLLLSP